MSARPEDLQGKFHIYAVKSIGEGIEILTGMPAGVKSNGQYPEGTLNRLVEHRLKALADGLKKFSESPPKDEKACDGDDQH
jgi:hypothetical protein